MAKSLSSRQAALMLFVVVISSKLLSLNSLISFDMANNTWFVFLVSFVIDFLFSLIFLYFVKKIDVPMFQYLKEKFGKVFTTIISILITVMLVFKTTMIMVDIYLFFVQLIYVEINRFVFISCFVLILFYFGSRKLQCLGRTIELIIWLILLSLALSLLLSFKAINLENLLPLLNVNLLTASKNVVLHNLWFGDFWILFFFVGN
ncbi:MAG: GerAB/ArcD/ProY family transporter, partial [Clostridia bacterium]|nr:GerAB/ArcD/ProY family transporter [Clostridia bacterium]